MSRAFARMAQVLAEQKRSVAVEAFLRELLTPNEQRDLELRWELLELLADGVSQRQIAARLGVSLCKITRGAKILKKRGGAVAGILRPSTSAVPKSAAKKSAPAVRRDKMKRVEKKAVKHGTRVSGKSKDKVRR